MQSNSESYWPLYVTLSSEVVQVGRWQQTRWQIADLRSAVEPKPEGAYPVTLELFLDERTNYRLNLDMDKPKLFLICDDKGDGVPVPMMMTANQNIAAGSLEGDTPVLTCSIPEAIVCWLEAFITRHGEMPIHAHQRKSVKVREEMKERQK